MRSNLLRPRPAPAATVRSLRSFSSSLLLFAGAAGMEGRSCFFFRQRPSVLRRQPARRAASRKPRTTRGPRGAGGAPRVLVGGSATRSRAPRGASSERRPGASRMPAGARPRAAAEGSSNVSFPTTTVPLSPARSFLVAAHPSQPLGEPTEGAEMLR